MKLKSLIIISVLFTNIFSLACTDRGTNIPSKVDEGFIRTPQDIKISPAVHVFHPELNFQVRNKFELMEIATYLPTVSLPEPYGPFENVPLLVLLPPQDGDQYYFFNHGLQHLADKLIADGTIEPMIISCISNDKVFGGYFYSSSDAAGMYDDIIGDALIEYLNSRFPLLDSPTKRGIGGVGMGSYGAFRASLLNDDVFSAISVSDGPLDFDGKNGSSGLIDLFDDALAEQGLDASTFKQFDSSGAWHISRLFIGGSLAFSPHDTLVIWHDEVNGNDRLTVVDQLFQIADTTTLISDIILGTKGISSDFHLPFDGNGIVYEPIWQLWDRNNLENLIIAQGGPAALNGTEIFVATTPEARYGYYDMTKSFISTLSNPPNNFKVKVYEYTGYDGNPATHDQYLYQVMKEMLIFHSNNFYGND